MPLRNAVSYSTRITNITPGDLDDMEENGRHLHKVAATYDDADMTPSTWSIANLMPVHSRITYKQYGFGIGCNTMEGREQKHQKVAKYQKHATFHCRWEKSFQHEAVELLYLRLNGHDKKIYRKRSRNYIPNNTIGCPTCKGSLNASRKCPLCDHVLNTKIDAEVEALPEPEMSSDVEDSVSATSYSYSYGPAEPKTKNQKRSRK